MITFFLSIINSIKLKVEFYTDFSTLPPCTTFNLEFEIAPIHDDLPPTACITSLPVNRVIYAYVIHPSTRLFGGFLNFALKNW